MTVYISVVSHLHGQLIEKLGCLAKLSQNFKIVVKVNSEEKPLISYLENYDIHVIDKSYGIGFGHNNNIVYDYCRNDLLMNNDDYFLVFNPDVVADFDSIKELVELMKRDNVDVSAVNLFKDEEYLIPDNSIRNFPNLYQFITSFLGISNSAIIKKESIECPTEVDWAAGSFLAFKAAHYGKLKGFDEGYFMYCEDIDICYRSNRLGAPVTFYPQIKMLHLAKHANRTIFSKHFYWHVTSVLRFLLSKVGLVKPKSSLN